ncbi:MAG: alpha/beta hydrolase [Deltaproteobacteria bacterium]|nr:alpha/beta hydrolase [Deltaproteobacteria bacterium]MBV8451130.1 alpha/beta hydrolase [Deltaproteobacteria bacterium]
MEAQTQTWTIGEFYFTVDTAGPAAGPAVLLLHGFPQTRHMWRHQLSALAAAGFRAVAPDQRGYSAGARPARVESYASELLTADALSLMDICGARRFHLVGHDWGGQLAWLIAAGHPDRVATLTMLSRPHPAAFARAMAEDPEQAKRSQHHTAFRQPEAIDRLRQDNFKMLRVVLEREGIATENLDAHFRTLSEPGALEAAINWYRANTIASAEIPTVSAPTLYIWGTADASVGRYAAELTAQFVSGPYWFVQIEGGGHFIVDQFPDRIAQLVIEHLRSTSL